MASRVVVPSELHVLPLPNDQVLFPSLILSVSLSASESQPVVQAAAAARAAGNPAPPLMVAAVPRRKELASEPVVVDAAEKVEPAAEEDAAEDGALVLHDGPESVSAEQLNDWGCAARIIRIERALGKPGKLIVVLEGVSRVRLDSVTLIQSRTSTSFKASVTLFPDQALPASTPASAQLLADLKTVGTTLLAHIGPLPPLVSRRLKVFVPSATMSQAGSLADLLVSQSGASWEEKLEVLGTPDVEERVKRSVEILSDQNAVYEVSKKVSATVQNNLSKQQREFILRQQLDAINRELASLNPPGSQPHSRRGPSHGQVDDEEEDELAVLSKAIEEAEHLSEEARTTARRELKRLNKIPPSSAEFNVIRTYLSWLLEMPWERSSEENIGPDFLARAKEQLDDDHYGLEKVKKRLLEYLAVRKLKLDLAEETAASTAVESSNVPALAEEPRPDGAAKPPPTQTKKLKIADKGPIILLVGPPGVGKTSIARSLAESMNRKFHRIALGGVRDEAELRGHRRTYVGAMPGVICQGLKKVGINNPVVLLDEVDKVSSGNGFHGDPQAALLEVLDPEQNNTFTDHYINLPVDLSTCLFIATANDVSTISAPLLDRMEVIELSGYTWDEKLAIARRYLLPKQLKANALQPSQVDIDDEIILKIATSYTREAGVRTLERELGSVLRAKAVQYAESRGSGAEYDPHVSEKDVEAALGIPRFEPEVAEKESKSGCATGLAYMGSGNGGILPIEATSYAGNGALQLSGSLGDVIQESAKVALTWVRSHAHELGLVEKREDDCLQGIDVHLHMPSGAVPKDGPSAGIAMVCAFVSLLTDRALPTTLAMTGEVTLRGLVTSVGGIREKLIGASRAGIRTVIIPHRNRKDVEGDVPAQVRDEMAIHYVKTIPQALDIAFGRLPGQHDAVFREESRL